MNKVSAKIPFLTLFSVGAVLFSAHAGGGFATGNQAQHLLRGAGLDWVPSARSGAMLLLTITMREAMIMYNCRGLTSYKELFRDAVPPL